MSAQLQVMRDKDTNQPGHVVATDHRATVQIPWDPTISESENEQRARAALDITLKEEGRAEAEGTPGPP